MRWNAETCWKPVIGKPESFVPRAIRCLVMLENLTKLWRSNANDQTEDGLGKSRCARQFKDGGGMGATASRVRPYSICWIIKTFPGSPSCLREPLMVRCVSDAPGEPSNPPGASTFFPSSDKASGGLLQTAVPLRQCLTTRYCKSCSISGADRDYLSR
jgi:hypothetical protein